MRACPFACFGAVCLTTWGAGLAFGACAGFSTALAVGVGSGFRVVACPLTFGVALGGPIRGSGVLRTAALLVDACTLASPRVGAEDTSRSRRTPELVFTAEAEATTGGVAFAVGGALPDGFGLAAAGPGCT